MHHKQARDGELRDGGRMVGRREATTDNVGFALLKFGVDEGKCHVRNVGGKW